MTEKGYASLQKGMPGHESEFLLNLREDRYADSKEIPADLEGRVKGRLGEGFEVANRGRRLEIVPPRLEMNEEVHRQVRQVIDELLGGEYEIHE